MQFQFSKHFMHINLRLQQFNQVSTLTICILEMGNLRQREVTSQGHTGSNDWN